MANDKHNMMVLFTLKHKLENWIREGQVLIQIIDSLIPPDNSKPLSPEQMRKEIDDIILFKQGHAKKISPELGKRNRNS